MEMAYLGSVINVKSFHNSMTILAEGKNLHKIELLPTFAVSYYYVMLSTEILWKF
jgi:hypothetical protein